MDVLLLEKAGVLAAAALVFMLLNIKAGSSVFKVLTFYCMIASLIGGTYFMVMAVFFP